MMYPVMRRCHQNILQYSQLTDGTGMNKKGIKSMHQLHTHDHSSGKADHREYRPETHSEKCLENSDPCRYGIIKVFTLMMHHMRGPQYIDLMGQPMIPIP